MDIKPVYYTRMQGCSANKKGVGTHPIAILKQLQTHFKAKREKGVGTPFPRIPPHHNPDDMPDRSRPELPTTAHPADLLLDGARGILPEQKSKQSNSCFPGKCCHCGMCAHIFCGKLKEFTHELTSYKQSY